MTQEKPNTMHTAMDFEKFTYLIHPFNHKVLHKVLIVISESEDALNKKYLIKSFIYCLKKLHGTCKA
jgi:hypothetical protein